MKAAVVSSCYDRMMERALTMSQKLGRICFQEYTGLAQDSEFVTKAERLAASKEELEKFLHDGEIPLLTKPTKFDLAAKMRKSEWNAAIFSQLGQECLRRATEPDAKIKLNDRIQQPQMETIIRQKYQRAFLHYNNILPKPGETAAERRKRIVNTTAQIKQKNRGLNRKNRKSGQRLLAAEGIVAKDKNVKLHALYVVKQLGNKGMSSEETATDPETKLSGFRVKEPRWRSKNATKVLHTLDERYKSMKNEKGAKSAPRFRDATVSTRDAMKNLEAEFYASDWLNERLQHPQAFLSQEKLPPFWMDHDTWEKKLNG
jgi:hypothetical protein